MPSHAARDAAAAVHPPIDRGAAWLGLLTIVAANLRYLSGLGAILDPMLQMEPYYIHLAGRPVADILREPPAWGPLYALWLKPLVVAFGDPLAVYAANLWTLSLAVSVLIYLHLLLLTRRAAIATGAALLFLISDANVPLASKVSGFALLVLLAGWIVAGWAAAGARRSTMAAGTVLVASYARPELYPAALALWSWALWRARREGSRAVLAPATLLALTLLLALSIGTPLSGGGRLLDAFREHFAWNWGTWHHGWRYYQAVWDEEFGGAQSFLAAVSANPAALAHHLGSNLLGTVGFLLGDGIRHYPLLAPVSSPEWTAGETWLITAALIAALGAVALQPAQRRLLVARAGDVLVAYAVVGLLCVSAAVVIYPRPHYLVIPCVLLLLAGAQAAALLVPTPPVRALGTRLLAAMACLAIVPRPFALPSAYAVDGSPFVARLSAARPVADTIARIRALGLPPPVHVLAMNDGMGELLGPGFEEVKIWQKGAQSLEAYIRDQHVDVIVTMDLGHEGFVVDDPHWTLIRRTPDAAGFTRVAVPGHESVGVFVRSVRGPGAVGIPSP